MQHSKWHSVGWKCYLQCCTPNGVLFLVYSFKSFGVLKAVPNGVLKRVLFAKWSAGSSTEWSAQKSVICNAALQTECCLWYIASSFLEG